RGTARDSSQHRQLLEYQSRLPLRSRRMIGKNFNWLAANGGSALSFTDRFTAQNSADVEFVYTRDVGRSRHGHKLLFANNSRHLAHTLHLSKVVPDDGHHHQENATMKKILLAALVLIPVNANAVLVKID